MGHKYIDATCCCDECGCGIFTDEDCYGINHGAYCEDCSGEFSATAENFDSETAFTNIFNNRLSAANY